MTPKEFVDYLRTSYKEEPTINTIHFLPWEGKLKYVKLIKKNATNTSDKTLFRIPSVIKLKTSENTYREAQFTILEGNEKKIFPLTAEGKDASTEKSNGTDKKEKEKQTWKIKDLTTFTCDEETYTPVSPINDLPNLRKNTHDPMGILLPDVPKLWLQRYGNGGFILLREVRLQVNEGSVEVRKSTSRESTFHLSDALLPSGSA